MKQMNISLINRPCNQELYNLAVLINQNPRILDTLESLHNDPNSEIWTYCPMDFEGKLIDILCQMSDEKFDNDVDRDIAYCVARAIGEYVHSVEMSLVKKFPVLLGKHRYLSGKRRDIRKLILRKVIEIFAELSGEFAGGFWWTNNSIDELQTLMQRIYEFSYISKELIYLNETT